MPRVVIGGNSGAGKDESARIRRRIDGTTNKIPQLGGHLPFIEEARRWTIEERTGCYVQQQANLGIIKEDVRVRGMQGGHRFPGSAGALEDHGSRCGESMFQHRIDDSWSIASPQFFGGIHAITVAQSDQEDEY